MLIYDSRIVFGDSIRTKDLSILNLLPKLIFYVGFLKDITVFSNFGSLSITSNKLDKKVTKGDFMG